MHWSRHLLACLRRITGAELLAGVRAVLHNPHFQHFVPPFAGDQRLGAAQEWPKVPALLLLDYFEPEAQQQLWSKVAAHGASVWVLLQDKSTDAQLRTVGMLRRLGARLSATLNAKSLVVHDTACWSDAKWDAQPARFATQLWHVEHGGAGKNQLCATPLSLFHLCWEAGKAAGMTSICAKSKRLSPYDYTENTNKMPSDTAGRDLS